MDNMLEKNRAPRGHRFGRKLVILAAAAALLITSAAAAAGAVRRAQTHFYDTADEAAAAAQAAAEEGGPGESSAFSYGWLPQNGQVSDFKEPDPIDIEALMSQCDRVLQHKIGGPEDGWNEMYQGKMRSGTHTRYVADNLSGLESLWPEGIPSVNLSWLDEHYRPYPGCQVYWIHQTDSEKTAFHTLGGYYHGQGNTIFSVDLTYHPAYQAQDDYMISTGQTVEEYTTADGVVVTIQESTTVSGRQCFWVSFDFGYYSFSMYGNELPLDELHALLDNMNLSVLVQ